MEAEMYAALENIIVATAPELCRKTGIPPSKAYFVLRSLEALGMLSTVHGRPMKYIGEPVDRSLPRLIDRRRRELEELGSEARALSTGNVTRKETVNGFIREASDNELLGIFREISQAGVRARVSLTRSAQSNLSSASLRLGIDLLGLVQAEWRAHRVKGDIFVARGRDLSFAVVDGATVHLLVLSAEEGGVVVTFNSPRLAGAILSP